MRVLITGASGLIGSELRAELTARGHQVAALLRASARPATPGSIVWHPGKPIDASQVAEFDAIVHLAGRPVATLWTERHKREIRESRVLFTSAISDAAIAAFGSGGRTRTLISSSAIGYYGSRGDEELFEESEAGLGFLASVCRDWEIAARPAAMAGLRVAQMRTSLVLDASGGALGKMLTPFRLGLGGRIGSGRQWWSWVTLRDAARAYVFALENPQVHGALNLATASPVTNEEFTRILGRVLRRPTIFPAPAFVLRALAGEMAEEMLLASQRVLPRRLGELGFRFEDPLLEPALRRLLKA